MITLLGIIATILFVSGAASQAIKTVKVGYADVSHGLIWNLLIGFVCMTVYTLYTVGWDWVFMSSYFLQTACIVTIGRYKYFPRRNK